MLVNLCGGFLFVPNKTPNRGDFSRVKVSKPEANRMIGIEGLDVAFVPDLLDPSIHTGLSMCTKSVSSELHWMKPLMFLWRTLNLDVHSVIVVLNAVHDLAAVFARIFGPQLCYLHGGVSGHQWVVDHRHSVQILCLDINFSLWRHQDRGDFLLGDVGPFDAVGERGDGRGSGVIDCVVLEVTRYHYLAAQQRT